MSTTVVRPADPERHRALRLAAAFGLFTVLFHTALTLWSAHLGWGYFRDEFYYLLCGRRLAWGYVDHGPLVALQARLSETLFGRSLAGLRLLSAIGGGLRVFLTGILAYELGGRRAAQTLAMLGVSIATIYLVLDSFLSMNSWESAFWMTCLLLVLAIARGASPRLWLAFGLCAGTGFLNKPSIAFFLIALLVAMLLTPQRTLLRSKWLFAGIALMALLIAPNLLWQARHHWAILEFLHSSGIVHADDRPSPLGLLQSQWTGLHPLGILIWLPGLVWLLRRTEGRWLGLTFVLFYAAMTALHAKDYYPTPIYPLLFAAGGVAWSTRLKSAARDRLIAFPILESALLLAGLLLLPIAIPVTSPAGWYAYARTLHLRDQVSDRNALLPQYLADRFGWQEEVESVQQVVASLPPEDRSRVRILCSNYGEAGALEFLGHDLRPVISGHNNYWWWGPHDATGEVMIVINGASQGEMLESYRSAIVAGHMHSAYAMPYEDRRTIWLARGRKQNLTGDWANLKHYD